MPVRVNIEEMSTEFVRCVAKEGGLRTVKLRKMPERNLNLEHAVYVCVNGNLLTLRVSRQLRVL